MNEIIAVTRLHYGLDYLPWVIKSSAPIADKHVILYTEQSSFRPELGRDGCPDSREALQAAAIQADPERVVWVEGRPIDIYQAAQVIPEAYAILELDADEVISPQLCQTIRRLLTERELGAAVYRLPMMHHWRSFNYICRNPGWPTRLFFPRRPRTEEDHYLPGGYEAGVIHHFGYARRRADMEYKVRLSMHREEWRPDWWATRYNCFPAVLKDVHPTTPDLWNAEPYDKMQLPEIMRDHPYFNLDIIE